MNYKRYIWTIYGLLEPTVLYMAPGIKLVRHSWPIALVSAALSTVVDSPWAPRSCSASWCRSPEKNHQSFKWDHKMGGNLYGSYASGYYWPVESYCAPKKCPCSPGVSCISRCWSQNDSWGKKKKQRESTPMQNFWIVLWDVKHLHNIKEWRYVLQKNMWSA